MIIWELDKLIQKNISMMNELNFQLLKFEHIKDIYNITNKYKSYSDLNFTSLISWCEKVEFAIDNGDLFLKFDDYSSNGHILTGVSDRPDTFVRKLVTLHRYLDDTSIDTVPAQVIENLQDSELRDRFTISENQSDYIYYPDSQLELVGKKYSWHRRKLSIFARKNEQVSTEIGNSIGTEEKNIFSTIWTEWKNPSNPKEVIAIKRYLNYFPNFINQIVLKIRLNDKLEGYAFCEIVNGVTRGIIIHFFKTNKAHEGLSNKLFFEVAKFAKENKLEYINFEQDLDEPGLRYYKKHLRPDRMLDKYSYQ